MLLTVKNLKARNIKVNYVKVDCLKVKSQKIKNLKVKIAKVLKLKSDANEGLSSGLVIKDCKKFCIQPRLLSHGSPICICTCILYLYFVFVKSVPPNKTKISLPWLTS